MGRLLPDPVSHAVGPVPVDLAPGAPFFLSFFSPYSLRCSPSFLSQRSVHGERFAHLLVVPPSSGHSLVLGLRFSQWHPSWKFPLADFCFG